MSNKKTKGIMLLLVIAVILMTVGFAAYSQNLNITGNVTVKGKPWNVHYDTTSLQQAGVTATNPTLGETDFSFTVTLAKPGDYYEATFNAKNYGTMTAYLKSVTMSAITGHTDYLTYTVTVDGTEYSATNASISGKSIAPDASHVVKVKVQYKADVDESDLPANDVTVTVTGTLNYSSEA